MSEVKEPFLMHYGIKGMKWGVRRPVGPNGLVRSGPTRREQKARNHRKQASASRRTLSDNDLDTLVQRLEKEKKLKALVAQDLTPGKVAVEALLKNAGTKVAGTVLAGAGMYAVRGLLTKDWSLKEFASNIPKMKK